jgi:hypothetical protein
MKKVIRVVLFDFGGVLAEEGFRDGLMTIGRKNGLDQETFFTTVDALIYETAYLIGGADEASFWSVVRRRTGISGSDVELRNEILNRFVPRPDMISSVDQVRSRGCTVALLSDQTNWLEEIDRQTGLFRHFDVVSMIILSTSNALGGRVCRRSILRAGMRTKNRWRDYVTTVCFGTGELKKCRIRYFKEWDFIIRGTFSPVPRARIP